MIFLNNGVGNVTILRLDKDSLKSALTETNTVHGVNNTATPGTEGNPYDLNAFVINKPTQVITLPDQHQVISMAVVDFLAESFQLEVHSGVITNVTSPPISGFVWGNIIDNVHGIINLNTADPLDIIFGSTTGQPKPLELFSIKSKGLQALGQRPVFFGFSIKVSFNLDIAGSSGGVPNLGRHFGQIDPLVKITSQ